MHHLMLKYFSIYQIFNPFKFNQIMVWTRDKFYRFLKNALFTFCNFFAFWGRFCGLAMKNRKEFHLNFIRMGNISLGFWVKRLAYYSLGEKICQNSYEILSFRMKFKRNSFAWRFAWAVCNLQCSRKFETVIGQIYF